MNYLIYDKNKLISKMVLVNKKMLLGGMAMIIVGLVFTININAATP
ncbi:MAG: hypothetical protein HOG57_00205, partial [Nitrosopumilus sp.]|nr:hypothetical protein [Nitrosopumilus sp.]